MKDGVFDSDKIINLLKIETKKALKEGYTALRVIGEMTWVLKDLSEMKKLIIYESKLNEFIPESKCLAICQYDQRQFSSEILLGVLRTHSNAVINTEIFDNFYYIPPDKFFSENLSQIVLLSFGEFSFSYLYHQL